jgi:VIT1/CCC1 family predicted Fe2+/Mn2+ transporter
MASPRRVHPDYLRSLMFGCEDGLVSTTGSVVGIAIGSNDGRVLAMAGVVLVAVEAMSMAAGQLLSERAVHQLEGGHEDSAAVGALLMGVAYALAGLVPVAPILLTRSVDAVPVSVALALLALVVLGVAKGALVGVNRIRSGVEVLAIGGIACGIGILAGWLFRV